jgi:hypothetical protein
VGVRIDGRDDAPGAFDTGRLERGFFRGVAFDLEEAFTTGTGQRFGEDVDDDDLQARMHQFACDRVPDAAVAAQDVVARQFADRIGHPSGLPIAAGRFDDEVLRHDPD